MNNKAQIMIVEDDETLSLEIKSFLEKWGYFAHRVTDFENILGEIRKFNPSLVLMDINLPFFDGFYWCGKIREISDIPVIFISSRGEDYDKLQGYAKGGDDYVEKPFRLEILQAKIEAILRRTKGAAINTKIQLSNTVFFEQDTMSLLHNDEVIELTKSERKVVAKLVECRNQIVSREELMMALWSTDEFIADGTLTTMMSRLRSKVTNICGEELIETKKGQGYILKSL